MAKINPFLKKRPTRPVQTRTFTDEEQPGDEITLSMWILDSIDGHEALDIAEEFTQTYLTGNPVEGTEAADFPAIDGRVVKLSHSLIRNVSNLLAMQSAVTQSGEPNQEKYTFEELIGISVTYPNAWKQILKFANEVEAAGSKAKKPDSAEPGESASGSVSDTLSATPNSTSDLTLSSVA